jgi:hypothetical protein
MSNQSVNNLSVTNTINATNLNCDEINCEDIEVSNSFTTSNLNVQSINQSVTSQNLASLDTTTSLVLQLANLKTYVDNQIATLFNNPDVSLNSIVELANALQNDKNYATNMLTSLADKLSLTQNNQTVYGNNLVFYNPITTPNILIRNNDDTTTSLVSQIATLQTNKAEASALTSKADVSYVDQKDAAINSELATKASLTSVGIGLMTKVDNSEYTPTINSINGSISTINSTLSQKSNLTQTVRTDLNTLQTVPYLASGAIRSATQESHNITVHTDSNLNNTYFNVLTFYAPQSFAGSKLSIEVLGGAFSNLQSNVNESDKLVIEITLLDNNPTFSTVPNVVSNHYFVGSNDLNTDWCTDVLLVRNTEPGYTPNSFSWTLLLRLSIGTFSVFAKCSSGTTIKHNSINLGFADPTAGLTASQWFRSVNSFGIRSPAFLFSSLSSNGITNSGTITTGNINTTNYSPFLGGICYPGMYGAILLDGVSSTEGFNKYNIMCSERKFGPSMNGVSDALILMPMFGIIIYNEALYGGTGYVFRNTSETTPQVFDFSSVQAYGNISNPLFLSTPTNINNTLNSCKLYRRSGLSWLEISYPGMS